jgi:uncharacterized membrane protein
VPADDRERVALATRSPVAAHAPLRGRRESRLMRPSLQATAHRYLGGAILLSLVAAGGMFALARNAVPRDVLVALTWDAGVLVFVVLVLLVASRYDERDMPRKVRHPHPGLLTLLATAGACFGVYAIFLLVTATGNVPPELVAKHVAVGATTTVLSWTLVHLLFGLAYAGMYYTAPESEPGSQPFGGLAFPGTGLPNYLDFFYFSFIIGVASQTADVSITSRAMRKVSLLHSLVAFAFNTLILAGTINVAASLV